MIAYDYEKVTDWDKIMDIAGAAFSLIAIAGVTYIIVQSGGLASVLIPLV